MTAHNEAIVRGRWLVAGIIALGLVVWGAMAWMVRTDWIRKNRAAAVTAGEIPGADTHERRETTDSQPRQAGTPTFEVR
jgi:hypothetical protein